MLRGVGGGGGWGVHPDFYVVKLDFETAVDQQTRPCDRGTATSIFGQFWQITLKCSTPCFGALLVATNLLNTCI